MQIGTELAALVQKEADRTRQRVDAVEADTSKALTDARAQLAQFEATHSETAAKGTRNQLLVITMLVLNILALGFLIYRVVT